MYVSATEVCHARYLFNETFFFVNYLLGDHENFIDCGNKFRQLLLYSLSYKLKFTINHVYTKIRTKLKKFIESRINQLNFENEYHIMVFKPNDKLHLPSMKNFEQTFFEIEHIALYIFFYFHITDDIIFTLHSIQYFHVTDDMKKK